MKNKISVIIPTYNVEKYIQKCLDSIISQTRKVDEIICIDDYSKDNTFKILEEYQRKYKYIKAFKNPKNLGAGASRNQGVKLAKNNWISFVDGDDYLENNFYEELINALEKNNADLAVCDIFVKFENSNGFNERNITGGFNLTSYDYINNGLAASPCNKIFKKEDLIKYPFPEGIMNEDVATTLACIFYAKKIAYSSQTFYNYIQHEKSVQNSSLSEKRLDIFKSLNILKERIPNKKETKKIWDAIYYNQLIMFLVFVLPKEESFKLRKQFLKSFGEKSKEYNLANNGLWQQEFIPNQGTKHKVYFKLFMLFYSKNLYFLCNILISFYHLISKTKKSIIPSNIDINKLIKLASIQSKLSMNDIKLSVIIPNYNYEKFLYQRLYSILSQKEKIYEIIVLDDCSKDNSRNLIDNLVKELSPYINISKNYNENNSGSAFKQWEKGFKLAKGNYIWIAEADDYCNKNFLKAVLSPIKKDNNIVISYTDTAFINQEGFIIMRTIKPEIDILKTGHWDKNFINNGLNEIENYSYLNCTIANVSSVIFKNGNYNEFFKKSGNYKQAGDWLFYLNIMKEGSISYINKPLNYYRLHGSNATSINKKQLHFEEIKKVHEEVKKMVKLDKEKEKNIKDRYAFLEKVWNLKK